MKTTTLKQATKSTVITKKQPAKKSATVATTKESKESARVEALESAKSAKKAKAQDDKTFYAMQAIVALVKSGCEQVSYKSNKSGSVLWVKINNREEIDALGNAVISNIFKAAGLFNQKCESFTLCKTGTKCLWIK
jgi:hypothetical protein